MAIITSKPTAKPVEVLNTVRITAPEYKGVTVDTRYVPQSSLLTHIEGSSWNVNYYSQVLNSDNALAGQNVNRAAIYQQYKLIKDFEFKVTTPLTTSQDNDGKTMTLTGSANIYPMVIPNEGDMFIADIGDGREGLFRITLSERKAIFKDTCYLVEYQLIDYNTEERRSDLNTKTIQVLQFVKDFLQYGQNPLLYEADYVLVKELQGRCSDMASRYFKTFMSNEYKTLILPGQSLPVYDHFLTIAVTSFFTTYDTPELRYIKKLNCDGDDNMKSPMLWDVLMTRDRKILKHCSAQYGLVDARSFAFNPIFEGIYFSGIYSVIYPRDPELSTDAARLMNVKVLLDNGLVDTSSRVRNLADLISDNKFEGLTRPDVIPVHKVLQDDYYVLSKAFYENAEVGKSQLEICVDDYLDNKPANHRALLSFCNTYHSWNALERFYYIPIILMLLKAATRGL